MGRRYTAKEKRAILAEIDAAPRGGKQAVLDRHEVTSQAVSR